MEDLIMDRRVPPFLRLGLAAVVIAGCSSSKEPPHCQNNPLPIKPLMGDRQLVVSSLAIASNKEGFDLNGDGKIDNKLAPLGALANPSIVDEFSTTHDIVLQMELFGYTGMDTDCTKFAFYLGRFNEDRDIDGATTTWALGKGDCDDTDATIHPGATENTTNRVDDDCDGFADNPTKGSPPTDTQDLDGDGVTLAEGDCDDRGDAAHIAEAKLRHPAVASKGIAAAPEICGNGIDEDCNGIPDDGAKCDPFADNDVSMHVQALSFQNTPTIPDGGVADPAGLLPLITFPDGFVSNHTLKAGPDLFKLDIDISGVSLTLTLSRAIVSMDLQEKNGGTYVTQGLLGGVLEVVSLAQIHIDASSFCNKQQSLFDCIFASSIGSIIGLPMDAQGHYQPDIDVDGDGLESFWQQDTGGTGPALVDTCQDGDGTIVHNNWDGKGTSCALAKDPQGNYRFVDGISAALKYTAVPVKLVDITEK
jgi:hypothetical protein